MVLKKEYNTVLKKTFIDFKKMYDIPVSITKGLRNTYIKLEIHFYNVMFYPKRIFVLSPFSISQHEQDIRTQCG